MEGSRSQAQAGWVNLLATMMGAINLMELMKNKSNRVNRRSMEQNGKACNCVPPADLGFLSKSYATSRSRTGDRYSVTGASVIVCPSL